ncbi:unnamed protein product, partial [Arctogadus glacialis]
SSDEFQPPISGALLKINEGGIDFSYAIPRVESKEGDKGDKTTGLNGGLLVATGG